jgi:hypothetical protein
MALPVPEGHFYMLIFNTALRFESKLVPIHGFIKSDYTNVINIKGMSLKVPLENGGFRGILKSGQ